MKPWLHKIEVIVDKMIPYLLVVLLFIIVGDIFFYHELEHWHWLMHDIDMFIIGVFVLDLVFKWMRIHKFWPFLKKCWLDILAVFPFVLFFRLLEEAYILVRFSRYFEQGQQLLHELLETEKEVAKIAREVEKAGKVSRIRLFSRAGRYFRFIRPAARTPRFLKAFAFYEMPHKAKKITGAKTSQSRRKKSRKRKKAKIR